MRKIKKSAGYAFLSCLLAACPRPALAAAIVNLTDHDIQVERDTSEGFVPVGIAAGRTYRVPGMVKFRYNGREVFIEHRDMYAVWPDGTFGPQQHTDHPPAQ